MELNELWSYNIDELVSQSLESLILTHANTLLHRHKSGVWWGKLQTIPMPKRAMCEPIDRLVCGNVSSMSLPPF